MLPESVQHTLETADATIAKTIEQDHLPGIGVGLVYRGDLIYARGFGQANVAQKVPATPETVFRIASISKTFAAVALMQLWEQGRFDLQDPVNRHLTSYQVQNRGGSPITIHHLLTHTAGLGEFASLWRYLSPRAHFNVVNPHKPVPALRHLYGRFLKAERPAGEKWCYANNGYATVGQLVADISGESFAAYTRAHIFGPLGMESADFWRSERVKPKLAIGYSYKDKPNRFKPVPDLEQVTTAAGAMYASVNDMARYIMALINDGQNEFGQILQPGTLEMMFTPKFQLDARLQGMGYGFKVDDWGGHRVVSHDGLWLGFVSSMFAAPDADLGVIAITNRASNVAIRVARQLLQRALDYNPRPLRRSDGEKLPDTAELWPDLIGFYGPSPGFNTNFRFWQQSGGEYEVFVDEGKLQIRSNWGSWRKGYSLRRAEADDPLSFQVGTTPLLFRRGDDGRMQLLKGLYQYYQRPYPKSIKRKLDRVGFHKLLKK